jgi:hypothetical protein
VLAEKRNEWQTSDCRYLTMSRAFVHDLEENITLKREAA